MVTEPAKTEQQSGNLASRFPTAYTILFLLHNNMKLCEF